MRERGILRFRRRLVFDDVCHARKNGADDFFLFLAGLQPGMRFTMVTLAYV